METSPLVNANILLTQAAAMAEGAKAILKGHESYETEKAADEVGCAIYTIQDAVKLIESRILDSARLGSDIP